MKTIPILFNTDLNPDLKVLEIIWIHSTWEYSFEFRRT
jgi:hypothetical protein